MKYRSRILVAVICLVFLCIIIGQAKNSFEREPLSAAMHAMGAGVEELSVNAWANLPADTGQNDADLEAVAHSAMAKLGISGYQLSQHQTDYQHMARAEWIADYSHVVVIAERISSTKKPEQDEVYLVVLVETKPGSETELQAWQNKISEVIKNFGGFPRISTCLVGWLDGKLEDGETSIALENGFKTANATMIDSIRYDNFASNTGYVPGITEYLEVGGKKVNINMAMRYSSYDDRTYITIGSPVITREY
ncbi:hypothetical protein SDC9_14699 [bioreactor metagenome]|uniref:Uncharacterized protein n=1 Tax=bioreactor metagenome TaxID=1076179 RepID=A0A644TPP6_9ZZZZ